MNGKSSQVNRNSRQKTETKNNLKLKNLGTEPVGTETIGIKTVRSQL
ncbi:hypothetical protein [Methanosarcina barkeri]|nr:hypothetical protein [Methanosarcina barkeri]